MNVFINELVRLQQDGSGAISAPSNWANPPLLEVTTDLDLIIDELLISALVGSPPSTTGRWHFFVGSPGNGKSAAVGKLWRKMKEKFLVTFRAHRHNGDVVDFEELGNEEIPYLVEVFKDNNKFPSLWIAQDASVVKDPYVPNVNPASDLLELLSDAWHKGVSLVVCTNRGVVERAFREGKEQYKASKPDWFKSVARVADNVIDNGKKVLEFNSNQDNKKAVFKSISFTYTTLDIRSLALCNDTFAQLVKKATEPSKWECCIRCDERELCPFFLNKNWLSSEGGAVVLSSLIAYAELLSGQVVVFREANAMLSFLLAGCPHDYPGSTPCGWVREKVASKDYFALLSRRFYVSLFSSHRPYALEPNLVARRRQLSEFSDIVSAISGTELALVLSHVLKRYGNSLSTDVGLSRLLGPNGEFSRMDPLLLPRDGSFYDEWDSDLRNILEMSNPSVSTLERLCVRNWIELEKHLEGLPACVEKMKALRRWISAFTIRLGATISGEVCLARELAKLVEVIALSSKQEWTEQELRKFSELQEHLRELVFNGDSGIRLRDNVSLVGNWAMTNLVPKITRHTGLNSLGLQVEVGKQVVHVNGHLFTWLVRKRDDKLSTCSFPPELLETIIDAQSMAACRGDYAFQDDGVTLRINHPDGGQLRMERIINGEVTVNAD